MDKASLNRFAERAKSRVWFLAAILATIALIPLTVYFMPQIMSFK